VRKRIGVGALIGVGTVIFALVVWLAFSLGFQRLRADLDIEMKTAVNDVPEVEFQAGNQGWEEVDDRDAAFEHQYVNITKDGDSLCMFAWETGRYDDDIVQVPNELNDLGATEFILERLGYEQGGKSSVQVETSSKLTLELIYDQHVQDNELAVATAVRAFTGSGHYVVFILTCDNEAVLNESLMMCALGDVEIELVPAS
jgi:hypothetical protein